jgi:hypothetical protein
MAFCLMLEFEFWQLHEELQWSLKMITKIWLPVYDIPSWKKEINDDILNVSKLTIQNINFKFPFQNFFKTFEVKFMKRKVCYIIRFSKFGAWTKHNFEMAFTNFEACIIVINMTIMQNINVMILNKWLPMFILLIASNSLNTITL